MCLTCYLPLSKFTLLRNGRIPLPRGYSQALRRCAFLFFIFKLSFLRSSSRLSMVKGHRFTLANKEREILAREQALVEKEQHLTSLSNHKDQEIASLHQLVSQLQQSHQVTQQGLSSRLSFVEKRSLESSFASRGKRWHWPGPNMRRRLWKRCKIESSSSLMLGQGGKLKLAKKSRRTLMRGCSEW